ncbi:MAG: porin family protein [Saprospiraceae bacterium]
MKIYLVIIFHALFALSLAQAQHFNLGIKGGLNFYTIHNNNNVKFDPITDVHFGLLGHIHLDRQYAIQPELVYSAQGAQISSNSKIMLKYINFPVLFQYMFDNGFRLQAGPQVGFLLNAKSKINSTSTDVDQNFESVDVGLSAGIGYVHPPSGIGFDLRYNAGLSNINVPKTTVKSTNNGLQLGLFYLFNHKS